MVTGLYDAERQCAWKLLMEMSDRKAVVGAGDNQVPFEGELLVESLDSLYQFHQKTRELMEELPVDLLHAGQRPPVLLRIFTDIRQALRPFLETWHADYRYWWTHLSNEKVPPKARQLTYDRKQAFLEAWTHLRGRMRKIRAELLDAYELPDPMATEED